MVSSLLSSSKSLTEVADAAGADRAAVLDARARSLVPWPSTGGELRRWREEMGWSQGEAASALGVGRRAYVRWEAWGRLRRRVALACWALLRIREGVE